MVCGRQLRKDRSHPVCAISSDKTNAAPLDLQSWILVASLVSHASECWTIRTAFALSKRENDGAETSTRLAKKRNAHSVRDLGIVLPSYSKLPLRGNLSCSGFFLFALFFVGLIRSATIGFRCIEAAINHASNPKSSPLAGLISPNTRAASSVAAPCRNAQSATDACAARSDPAIRCTCSTVNVQRLRWEVASGPGAWRLIIAS